VASFDSLYFKRTKHNGFVASIADARTLPTNSNLHNMSKHASDLMESYTNSTSLSENLNAITTALTSKIQEVTLTEAPIPLTAIRTFLVDDQVHIIGFSLENSSAGTIDPTTGCFHPIFDTATTEEGPSVQLVNRTVPANSLLYLSSNSVAAPLQLTPGSDFKVNLDGLTEQSFSSKVTETEYEALKGYFYKTRDQFEELLANNQTAHQNRSMAILLTHNDPSSLYNHDYLPNAFDNANLAVDRCLKQSGLGDVSFTIMRLVQ